MHQDHKYRVIFDCMLTLLIYNNTNKNISYIWQNNCIYKIFKSITSGESVCLTVNWTHPLITHNTINTYTYPQLTDWPWALDISKWLHKSSVCVITKHKDTFTLFSVNISGMFWCNSCAALFEEASPSSNRAQMIWSLEIHLLHISLIE